LVRASCRRFCRCDCWFEEPASLNAIATAWRRLFTLPPRLLSSSPCFHSCMTRPTVFFWAELCFAMASSAKDRRRRQTGGALCVVTRPV
jgi:hypothetical protein